MLHYAKKWRCKKINTKIAGSLFAILLLVGIGSFAFGHAADAQKSTFKGDTPAKKDTTAKTKVDKQRENRDKQFGHENWTKKHSIIK